MDASPNLKSIYADICRGYSLIRVAPYDNFFVKHFTSLDTAQLEFKKELYHQFAVDQGMPTLKEQEEIIYGRGLWTKERDKEIEAQEEYIKRLYITKSKLARKSDVKTITDQIGREEAKVNGWKFEKSELFKSNVETYAAKRLNSYYIYHSLKKDNNLEEPYFDEKDFEELEEEKIAEIVSAYNKRFLEITDKNIKKIALAPFFCNFFYLCDNNPHTFYGKPIVSLTYFQAELFGMARRFKSILENAGDSPPPESVLADPDKLLAWHESSVNTKPLIEKASEGNVMLVGEKGDFADSVDFAENTTVNFAEAARKNGGQLNMMDILKLQTPPGAQK